MAFPMRFRVLPVAMSSNAMQVSSEMTLSPGSEPDNLHSEEVEVKGDNTPRAKVSSFTDNDSVEEYEEQEDSEEDWEDTEEELQEEVEEEVEEEGKDGEGRIGSHVSEGMAVVEMPKVSQEYESVEKEEDSNFVTSEYPALAVSEENFEVEGNDYIPKPYNGDKEAYHEEEEEEEEEGGSVEDREDSDEDYEQVLDGEKNDTISVYSHSLSFRAGSTVNGVDVDDLDTEEEEGGNTPMDKISDERVTEKLVSLRVRSVDRVQGVRFDDEEVEEGEEEEEAEVDAGEEDKDDGSQHENGDGVGTEFLQEEGKEEGERKMLSPEAENVSVEQPALDSKIPVSSVVEDASVKAAVSETTSTQSLSLDRRRSSEGPETKQEDASNVNSHRLSDSNASVDSKRRFSEESEAMSYYYDSDNDDDLRPPGCFGVCHVVVDVMKKMGVKKAM